MRNVIKESLLSTLVLIVIVCVFPCVSLAEKIGDTEIVTMEQLPAAVRKTLVRESTGGTVSEIEKETKNGRVVYEAEVKLDGLKYDVKITADGILLIKKLQRPRDTVTLTYSFERNQPGSVPVEWHAAETNGKGKKATWKVIPGGCKSKKAIAITENTNSGQTYNLLIGRKIENKNLKVSVMVKSMTGKQDQGGGPIWRAKDADNYYIARWNPLEDNFRVYYVKDGKRVQLGSAEIKTDASKWHEIEIEHVGSKIVAEFDNKKVIEIEDTTFSEAGMVGLWTKADAATAFDDFKVKIEDR
jgi:hypothetical protein